MRTAETVLPGASTAHVAGDGVPRGGGARARWVGVVAALLAFGLLGVLVAMWHLRRGRPAAALACPSCRRRRGRVLAGTVLLAVVVLVGSGMAVHQQVSGPSLPPCHSQLPENTTAQRGHPLGEAAGGIWLETRRALTAPVSGLARHYVAHRGGGLCQGRSMTLAFLPSAASDSSVAVGSVVLAGSQTSMGKGEWSALSSHESRHVTQWAVLTLSAGPLAMPLLYAVDEAFFPESLNHFERAADLADGGYTHPGDFGPEPQMGKICVIGVLLLTVAWRRLRWTSRVLVGGPAAAVACEPGVCPLHSRGWFLSRPGPAS